MSLCRVNPGGESMLHHNMKTAPEPVRKAMAPDRGDRVVCVEGLFTWDGLADLCAHEGIPCGLGHALDRKAIHGGTAQHDTLDAHQLAVLLGGGMLPPASVEPAQMRATRALRRRRMPLARTRGALLAHVQHTTSQDNLPAIGHQIASQTHRDGGTARCADPAVHHSIDVDLALIGWYDALLRDVELPIVNSAKPPDAHPLDLLHTVPGIGKRLSLGRLDAIHQRDRVPPGQDFAAYGRLVKGAKESAGKRSGTSGTNIGNAPLQWACSAAAVFGLREHPAGQQCFASGEKKHGQGQALTVLAQT